MIDKFKSVFDIEREEGYMEGFREGCREKYREGIQMYLSKSFPHIPQSLMNRILLITDLNVLDTIFDIAIDSDSLADFKKNVGGLIPTN